MAEKTEVRRSRDLRTLAAVLRFAMTGEKVFAVGDTVQLGKKLYRVSFWGPFGRVVLRDLATNEPLATYNGSLNSVRLVKKGSRRG